VLKLNLPIAVLVSFALATSALAAPITTFTYTYTGSNPTPNATYPDTGGVELNNNNLSTTAYTDAQWVGFGPFTNPPSLTGPVRVNVTFNVKYNFTSLAVTFLEDTSTAQAIAPAGLTITYDGGAIPNSTFTQTSFDNSAGVAVRTATLSLTGKAGTTVQLDFTRPTSAQPNYWLFLSELDFDGVPAPIPEPASAALMLVGGALLLARRRGCSSK
jgi:hypothetical protein